MNMLEGKKAESLDSNVRILTHCDHSDYCVFFDLDKLIDWDIDLNICIISILTYVREFHGETTTVNIVTRFEDKREFQEFSITDVGIKTAIDGDSSIHTIMFNRADYNARESSGLFCAHVCTDNH